LSAEQARLGYLAWLAKERRMAASTVDAYGADLTAFLAFLDDHLGGDPDLAALARLSVADLRAWLAHTAAAGAAAATRARQLSTVRGFYRYLDRRHGIANPAPKLIRGPRGRRPLPRALSVPSARTVAEEIGDVRSDAAIAARDSALFTLLYAAGLRIGEALSLDVGDLPDGQADPVVRICGKGGKERLLPLLPAARSTQGDPRLARLSPWSGCNDAALRGRARRAARSRSRAARDAGIPPAQRPTRAGDTPRTAALVCESPARRGRRFARHPGAPRPR
jgi:integrase/recombinase XerC